MRYQFEEPGEEEIFEEAEEDSFRQITSEDGVAAAAVGEGVHLKITMPEDAIDAIPRVTSFGTAHSPHRFE